MIVEIFPAINGDCFLVHTNEGIFLIDCGYSSTYKDHLKAALLELKKQGKNIKRFIITHIDEDHIQGAISFLIENGASDNPQVIAIEQIWHNSYRHLHSKRAAGKVSAIGESILKSSFKTLDDNTVKPISARQGSTLAALILKNGYSWNADFEGNAFSIDHYPVVILSDEVSIELLSPTDSALERLEKYWQKELYKLGFREKITSQEIFDDAFEFILMKEKVIPDSESSNKVSASEFDVEKLKLKECDPDKSAKNGSSLAFILNADGKKLLFMGDAIPAILLDSLGKKFATESKPIQFDLVKLSHHGSYSNNSPELFGIIDSVHYIISTKGESQPHPSKPTLAWIIGRPTTIERKIIFNYKNEGYNLLNQIELKGKYNYVTVLADQSSNRKIEI